MGSDEYDVMQDTRRAALRSAANFLEAVDRARQSRRRMAALFPETAEPAGDGERRREKKGDFLFDLLRLNARYLNQLSALGTAHSRIAHQALERLYASMVPMARPFAGYPGAPGETLVFSRTKRTLKFTIDHRFDPNVDSVTVRWRPLSPSMRAAKDWLVKVNRTPVVGKEHLDVEVEFGASNVIALTVTDKLPIARRYTSELLVDMGAQRRCIPVVIDFRARERDDS
jgi:hypothetical protein